MHQCLGFTQLCVLALGIRQQHCERYISQQANDTQSCSPCQATAGIHAASAFLQLPVPPTHRAASTQLVARRQQLSAQPHPAPARPPVDCTKAPFSAAAAAFSALSAFTLSLHAFTSLCSRSLDSASASGEVWSRATRSARNSAAPNLCSDAYHPPTYPAKYQGGKLSKIGQVRNSSPA